MTRNTASIGPAVVGAPVNIHSPPSWVQKTPGVCGGDACIRKTRIPVWLLVRSRQLGMSDEAIRADFDPPLSREDLEAAWNYHEANKNEIELAIRENEEE